jgi:predicted RNA methylase
MGKLNKLDKFYTKSEVVIDLLKLIDLKKYTKVVECSAGNGSFSLNINHKNIVALDLEPEHNSILKMNWFDFKDDLSNSIVVSNPPFGINNKLSKEFIKHAIKLNSKCIAFILPDVYNKPTLQSIIPKEYRITHIVKLPTNSFTVNGEDYDIPCSFFVLDKEGNEDLRFNISKYKTNDFEIINKRHSDEDCFFILGASPNTIKEISEINTNNRGYIIKPKDKTKYELIKIFKNIKFNGYSSVSGKVAWFSKVEIVKNYLERGF